VEELCWEWKDEGRLRLEFILNARAYATVIVRELVGGVP
jgi:tRNA(Glu) U13 pseudouridine synthase TruD